MSAQRNVFNFHSRKLYIHLTTYVYIMAETVSVRISKEDLKGINRISSFEHTTKSAVLRVVLDLGIKEKMLSLALIDFQKGKSSAWKASRTAGVPLSDFLDILKRKHLEYHYTEEEISEDFKDVQ